MPSDAARRKRSAGIACQPCRIIRVASGRFRKTCAKTTPCRPNIDSGGWPDADRIVLTGPARPNTANRPSTATTTGNTKGADISRIKASRPQNRRRCKARATGMASRVDTPAESAACNTVKRSADQSAGCKTHVSARAATIAALPRISAATASPSVTAGAIWKGRFAIPQSLWPGQLRPRLGIKGWLSLGLSGFQSLWANPLPGWSRDTSSWW